MQSISRRLFVIILLSLGNFSSFAGENTTGLSESTFNSLIDHFEAVFAPVILSKTNKKLVIKRDWPSDRVNAHATKDMENNYLLSVEGGIARNSEITPDGLWMILCHELGHHFGGAPKQFRGNSQLKSWSSAEGQADYYAATKCFPRLLEFKSEIGEKLKHKLNEVLASRPKEFSRIDSADDEEVSLAIKKCPGNLCVRMSLAGLSMGRVFASLREGHEWPSLSKEDSFEVLRTITSHPSPQCRLDTIVSAANCKQNPNVDFDVENPRIGACKDGEVGARPLCWYAPEI